jgi:hypothetical protein
MKRPSVPIQSPAAEKAKASVICQGQSHMDATVRMISGNASLCGMFKGRKYSRDVATNKAVDIYTMALRRLLFNLKNAISD